MVGYSIFVLQFSLDTEKNHSLEDLGESEDFAGRLIKALY